MDEFGTACAEVACLLKAFARRTAPQRATQPPLKDCVFVAWSVTQSKQWNACKTCRAWVAQYGGVAIDRS
jgi:hypothetical protein